MRSRFTSAAITSLILSLALPTSAADESKASAALATAERHFAIGSFDEAAKAHGTFAREFPSDPRAPRAFADALIMHSRLGTLHPSFAESDLGYFEDKFAASNLDLWAELAFTLVDGFVVRDDHLTATSLLHRALAFRDKLVAEARKKTSGSYSQSQILREIEIRARGRLARVLTERGDHRGAELEYTRIQSIMHDLWVWPSKKPPRPTTRHPETIEFIAETLFHAAELKRFDAERVHMPPYLGDGSRDSVLKYITGPGEKWFKDRRFAVDEAHRLYAFVLGADLPKSKPPPPPPPPPPSGMIGLLGGDPEAPLAPSGVDPFSHDYEGLPAPSPRWAIAAAERVGSLWSSYVQEFRRMPIPNTWKDPAVNYGASPHSFYELYLDSPGEEIKYRAKNAYRLCAELSIQHRIVNEHTRQCIHWLAKNYGAEYHEIDDFAPPGEFLALGLVTRPAPLPLFTR